MNVNVRPAEIEAQVVPMTVEALRILDDQGFFANDNNRHELIDGVLIVVPPPAASHQRSEGRALMALAKALFGSGLDKSLRLQTGGGYIIGDYNHVGPDLMIVREPNEIRNWIADDVIIMIEVAYSSLTKDLGDKARLYASAGIAEYWVLDVADKALIVHTEPVSSHYGNVQTLREPVSVTSFLEPSLCVAVKDLF